MARVLWMDNDTTYLMAHEGALRDQGHEVVRVPSVSEAEKRLRSEEWDAVIIDVMMAISEEEERLGYPPSITRSGKNAGIPFYVRNKDRISETGAVPLVLTMRSDKEVSDEFIALGIPQDQMRCKMDVSDVDAFTKWFNNALLGSSRTP